MIHRSGKKKSSNRRGPNIKTIGIGKGWRRSGRTLVDAKQALGALRVLRRRSKALPEVRVR